jgi:predicted lactoylglutathione lyase
MTLTSLIEFFTKLGYTFNPKFTDEKATCMIISDTIYVMLLTRNLSSKPSPRKKLSTLTKP